MGSRPPELHDHEIIDLRTDPDEAAMGRLLQDFYVDLYLPAFPIPSERESADIWRSYLWGERRRGPGELHVLVAGRDLQHPTRRRLSGGLIFVIYPKSRCALLTYVVVGPEFRGQGLVRRLFAEATRIVSERGVRAVLGEVNDPTKVGKDQDALDPWQRLVIMQRLGGLIVDVPYTQPELAPGQGRCSDLLLMAFPPPGSAQDALPTVVLKRFLFEFYRALGVRDPGRDPDLRRTLQAMQGPQVPLRPPEELARCSLGSAAAEALFGRGRSAGQAKGSDQ